MHAFRQNIFQNILIELGNQIVRCDDKHGVCDRKFGTVRTSGGLLWFHKPFGSVGAMAGPRAPLETNYFFCCGFLRGHRANLVAGGCVTNPYVQWAQWFARRRPWKPLIFGCFFREDGTTRVAGGRFTNPYAMFNGRNGWRAGAWKP